MAGLNFKAFMAGFADKAVEIETKSAQIGMDLLKESMDTFKEEAKDYKANYNSEIRGKKELAKALLGVLGEKNGDKVKIILDKGDVFAKTFLAKADDAYKYQRLEKIADLVPLAEGQEPLTGFDVIDYIDSGIYAKGKVPEPVYVGPEGMKSSVFRRDIGMGSEKALEQTKSAYIPTGKEYEGEVPRSTNVDINLSSSDVKNAYDATDLKGEKELKNAIVKQLAFGAGHTVTSYQGELNYGEMKAEIQASLEADANNIVAGIREQAKTDNMDIKTYAGNAGQTALDFMVGLGEDVRKLRYPEYPALAGKASITLPGGAQGAGTPGSSTPAPKTGGQVVPPLTTAALTALIQGIVNGTKGTRAKRGQIVNVLIAPPSNMSRADAEVEAEKLVP